ncbi:MAG TPA: G5 domain-containing protein [Anaerolineales bacterium]|nr:G5 domain-containing protein [Anaerolineales bacterium]
MRIRLGLALFFAMSLLSCQPVSPAPIILIEDGQVLTLQTDERIPSALLAKAGTSLDPHDDLLLNGIPIDPQQPITTKPITLQIRRARPLTLVTSAGEQQIHSSAFTVGQALADASIWLRADEKADPPFNAALLEPVVTFHNPPVQELTVTSNGATTSITTSAQTVGEALARAGMPLIGLDYSVPAEKEPLPANGQIRIVRVSESVQLAQRPIPFDSDLQASAEVPLDQTQILQPGEMGLTVERIRIRYEDGKEISRLTEDETVVRPPKTRIFGYGTKVEVKTTVVDGETIEYWRAVQMYATSYSPCRSGADRCYPGTSSGKSLRKGMVAMRYDWYLAMGGQPLFIPGYGYATIEDVCGGCTGRPWIDLGYSDNNWQQWSSWVTVYFLTPIPANIIYVLE